MAINQVSLFFYAPRWRQQLAPAGGHTPSGDPVMLASGAPADASAAAPVSAGAVKAWLRDRGFEPVEWAPTTAFRRGRVRSIFGPEQDVIIHVHGDADEVSYLYCRFTLTRHPPPLWEWAELVAAMCAAFGLRLPEHRSECGEQDFIAAVYRDHNYRRFAECSGWPNKPK